MEGKIESTLKGYAKLRPLRFHMPGHKAEKEFCKHFPGAAYDITELGFSDSLQHPEGIIREAEDEVRDVLGAKKTYFLTDGSTCGVRGAGIRQKDHRQPQRAPERIQRLQAVRD